MSGLETSDGFCERVGVQEKLAQAIEASGVGFGVAGVGASEGEDLADRGIGNLAAHADTVSFDRVTGIGVNDLQDVTTRVADLQTVAAGAGLHFNGGFSDFGLLLLHDVSTYSLR